MDAKKRLASEITGIYHDAEAARGRGRSSNAFSVTRDSAEMAEVSISADQFRDGRIWIVRLLTAAGMAQSNGEARRLVEQGGVSIDGERIDDVNAELEIREGQDTASGQAAFCADQT